MDEIRELQRQRNQAARATWELYAPHRQQVMRLLIAAAGNAAGDGAGGRKLAILGAGNANDLDLPALRTCYQEIHLVDLDGEALEIAVGFQGLANDSSLRLHGGVDLTGLLPWLERRGDGDPPAASELPAAIAAANAAPAPSLPDDLDVVASTCVLTQLIESALTVSRSESAASPTAEQLALAFAVRDRHLQMLCELPRPGGQSLLITDFVSSDTVPQLPSLSDEQLHQQAMQWLADRNFFTGCNPLAISARLSQDARFAERVVSHQVARPWKWPFVNRTYAVCGIAIQLRSSSAGDSAARRK